MKISPDALAAQLQQMELLSTVPREVLLELAGQCKMVQLETGRAVFKKGEPGNALYLILEGEAKVHDGDYTVAHMAAGHCFGEMALLDEGPRSMSVSATERCTLARIDRDVFFEVLGDYPDIMQGIVGLLTSRLRFQTDRTLEQLRKREEELTRLVEERTAQLREQKEEAERLRLRAEQSEQAEQQFLANMSHEIRTPMNAVMGITNLLLKKNPRDDQVRYLQNIRQSSEALLVILNDILDISKIQAGKLELEMTGVDVRDLFSRVRTILQVRAEEKGLLIVADCDPDLPLVLQTDLVRLQQILVNLAGNAVKFTERGMVAIKATVLEKKARQCRLRFSVEDTGIGMTPEQLKVVFESFRQASGDTTRKYGGTGLGLSISKQLVEQFGGVLEVASEPGRGTQFWFDINLEIGERIESPGTVTATEAGNGLRGLRILLAEDNPMNRLVAEETLALLIPDVRVTTAVDGREALQAVVEEDFDIVLMDVNMPEMDGIEASRRIRLLDGEKARIPIIAFTASVTRKEVQQCLDNGMNACVPKPFREIELLHAILKALSRETPPQTDPPIPEALNQISRGNPERARKYLNLYLEAAKSAIPRLEAAASQSDNQEIRRVVHTLKPQFKMLGMQEMAQTAQEIETHILENLPLTPVEHKLKTLIEDIRNSIRRFE